MKLEDIEKQWKECGGDYYAHGESQWAEMHADKFLALAKAVKKAHNVPIIPLQDYVEGRKKAEIEVELALEALEKDE